MSLHRPTRVPFRSLLALVALVVVASSAVPAAAHEGRADADATVLARVDGRLLDVRLGAADAVSLTSASDRTLLVVDLENAELPATAIDFAVDATRSLRLEVLDLDGQVVRTLAEGTWAGGRHRLAWHHDADSGETLEDGMYVVRMVRDEDPTTLVTAR